MLALNIFLHVDLSAPSLRCHEKQTVQEELAKEAETGAGGRGGLVLMGPALIPQDLRFLVVYVFSAQGLPGFSSVGVPSINALVQVCLSIPCARVRKKRRQTPNGEGMLPILTCYSKRRK